MQTYEEFSAYLAKYGFISNPLTREEYKEATETMHEDDLFGLACDMNAGISFGLAVLINSRTPQDA